MALVQMNFESKYLGNNHEITVILPDMPRNVTPAEFYGSGKKYKVLFLLHGTFGDHSDWVRKSNIELYACEKDLIVVMPSAMNSAYENWPNFTTGYQMWDYLTEELMPLIYHWFPASDKREDNFVAGLSMGGRGTMKLAIGHPEKFAAAAILSSCPQNLHENPLVKELEGADMNAIYAKIQSVQAEGGKALAQMRTLNDIARCGGVEGYLASNENTWDHIRPLAGSGKLPRLYFAMGTEDGGYAGYLRFQEYAREIGLDATFEEGPGRHEWRVWERFIQRALTFFGLDEEVMSKPF